MRFRALMILTFAFASLIPGACSQSRDSSYPVTPDTIFAESAEFAEEINIHLLG